MFGRKRRSPKPSGRHTACPTLDLTVPEGRHRLADGDTVANDGFGLQHGWNDATMTLPLLTERGPAPEYPMTPGQEYRAGGWRFCNG